MNTQGSNGEKWRLTKEKILLSFGLSLITVEWIAVVLFGKPFQFEWLLGGLACCGIAIAQWGGGKG